MTNEQLQQGKKLEREIKELKSALSCFEWTVDSDYFEQGQSIQHEPISRNPRLIIEFDDGDNGREQIALPMSLSDAFVDFMKKEITAGLTEAQGKLDGL